MQGAGRVHVSRPSERTYIEDKIALVGIENEIMRQRVGRRTARENDGVLRVLAPLRKQLPRETALEVRRAGQDQLVFARRVQTVQLVDGSTQLDVLEIERIVSARFERLAYFLVHPLHLGLGELDHADGHVVQESDGVGEEAGVFVLPKLVQKVRDF